MQVFRAHGIECEVLNGNLNQKERAEAVERFHKQPNIKVLLVSSVGGVGLNLTEADMVICFVCPFLLSYWSFTDRLSVCRTSYGQLLR